MNITELQELAEKATEHDGYSVDEQGNVWSSIKWRGMSRRKLSPSPNSHGYLVVKVKTDKGMKRAFVHKMVCTAFHGQKPSHAHEVRHLDGNKTNNKADNLLWGTKSENAADRTSHGTCAASRNGIASAEKTSASMKLLVASGMKNIAKGSKQGASKITETDAIRIRELRKELSLKVLASMFRIDQSTVSKIVRRKSWKHV